MLARTKIEAQTTRKWILGPSSLNTIAALVQSFRQAALLKLDSPEINYLPWMDSYCEHKNTSLFKEHKVWKHLLLDEDVLSKIENVFNRNDNPLGLMLPEEKSFRITQDILNHQEMIERYFRGIEFFWHAGRYWQNLLSTLCMFIVPIYSTRESVRPGGVGFSTLRARGAIFLSLPKNEKHSHLDLAINLAHELGHQSLMIYQGADRILNGKLDAPVYSVIRKTMRPAINSFHAVVALAFMVRFIADLLVANDLPDDGFLLLGRFVELRQNLTDGLETCRTLDFTEVGKKIFTECEEALIETRSLHYA